jgi:poly-gamma-glutamate synthesis protein (capsule biosynthesis protein)
VLSVHWRMVEDRVAIGDYQRVAAHAFIDNGADLILGHGRQVTKASRCARARRFSVRSASS